MIIPQYFKNIHPQLSTIILFNIHNPPIYYNPILWLSDIVLGPLSASSYKSWIAQSCHTHHLSTQIAQSHSPANGIHGSLRISPKNLPLVTTMRIQAQKNTYYIDLSQDIYQGYIETRITRIAEERILIYKASHMEIDVIQLVESKLPLEAHEHTADSFALMLPEDFKAENFTVRISFRPCKSTPQICWYRPVSEKDKHREVLAFNTPTSFAITPSIDAPTEFELVYVVPNCEEVFVASPGHLYAITEKDNNIIYAYKLVTHPKHLLFSIGTYSRTEIFSECDTRHLLAPSSFICVSGRAEYKNKFGSRHDSSPDRGNDLDDVILDLQAVISFIDSFSKCDTLSTLSIGFTMIDMPWLIAPNLIIFPLSMLPSPQDVEPMYIFKRQLAEAASGLVFRFLNWDIRDSWIPAGFSGYLADYCVRQMLGTNEFLYDYRRNREYVIAHDVLEPPLFYTKRHISGYSSEFFKAKSRLVFHCLEAHLSAAFLQKIAEEVVRLRSYQVAESSRLDNVVKFTKIENNSDNILNNNIADGKNIANNITDIKGINGITDIKGASSLGTVVTADASATVYGTDTQTEIFTPQFARVVKTTTGKDLGSFLEFYVFFPGLLHMTISIQIIRKRNTVHATVTQRPTSKLPGCNCKYALPITIKTSETEGIFEHSLSCEGDNTFFYHARTKKKKREDEEEENTMPLLFIHADPKRETLFKFVVEQPDYMHIEQLSEKNVLGQLEAIEALRSKPSALSCDALERLLESTHAFYKVRIEAMHALRAVKLPEYNGLQRLIQYFVRTRCVHNSTVLKANEFGLVQYFMQKHLIINISENPENEIYSDEFNGQLINNPPTEHKMLDHKMLEHRVSKHKTIISFLKHVLQFNDNSQSVFDDSWYLATVLSALGSQVIAFSAADDTEHCAMLINEIERLRILDMVFPSSGNIITRACLLTILKLAKAGLVSIRPETFQALAKYPNNASIRLAAMEILLFLGKTEFVIAHVRGDTPYIIQSALGLILDMLRQGKTVQIQHSQLRLLEPAAPEAVSEIMEFVAGRQVSSEEYVQLCTQQFTLLGEELVRNQLHRIGSGPKRVRVVGQEQLRLALFGQEGVIRLPRYGPVPRKKPALLVRLHISRYVPRKQGPLVFRMPMAVHRPVRNNEEIAILLATRISASAYNFIDSILRNAKPSEFFEWVPLPFQLIKEYALARYLEHSATGSDINTAVLGGAHSMPCCIKPSYKQIPNSLQVVYEHLEHSLIYLLSYTTFGTKTYIAARTLFGQLERMAYKYCLIPQDVVEMSAELRKECAVFINRLINNPAYACFVGAVDCSELKTYPDIVRIPVCFSDIAGQVEAYRSYERFVYAVERVVKNCLSFNRANSPIALAAEAVQKDLDGFREQILLQYPLAYTRSRDVILKVLEEVDGEGLMLGLRAGLEGCSIHTWGDLDEALERIRVEHPRYSTKRRACSVLIKEISRQIELYFPVISGKLIRIY